MKFYKRDPDAAISGMDELTLQERGAYNSILDRLYSRDGLLPDDDDLLRTLLRCHGREWKAVKARLLAKKKIWVVDGYLMAKGVEAVLEEASKFSQTQRKRALKRWEIEGKTPLNPEIIQQTQSSFDAIGQMPLTATATIKKKEERKKKVTPPTAAVMSEFPDWWPQEAWTGFSEMRKRIRAPLTARAVKLLVDRVTELKAAGHDPGKVLDQSTERGWRGVFELRAKTNGNGNGNGYHHNGAQPATLDGWVSRLRVFAGMTEVAPGSWATDWGPKPNEAQNQVPAEAARRFEAMRKGAH